MKWVYWWLVSRGMAMWRYLRSLLGEWAVRLIIVLGLLVLLMVAMARSCRSREEIYGDLLIPKEEKKAEVVLEKSALKILYDAKAKKDSVVGVLDTMSVERKRVRAGEIWKARRKR